MRILCPSLLETERGKFMLRGRNEAVAGITHPLFIFPLLLISDY